MATSENMSVPIGKAVTSVFALPLPLSQIDLKEAEIYSQRLMEGGRWCGYASIEASEHMTAHFVIFPSSRQASPVTLERDSHTGYRLIENGKSGVRVIAINEELAPLFASLS